MLPTGSIGLDIALGGGWVPGLHDIWGDTGSGKTVLALHAAESAVRARKEVLWIDTVDGVAHMDSAPRVIVGRPRNAEDAFAVAQMACQEESISLVVVDSANHLVRQRELDGDPDYVPHPQREYKTELTCLKHLALTFGTVVLFVSQPRDKQRQPIRGTGISEKATFRVHLHADVVHQDGSREIQVTARTGKVVNHNAAHFTIRPAKGIDQALELTQVAAGMNLIHKSGSWYHWPLGTPVHGQYEMAAELRRQPNLMESVDARIRELTGIS